MNISYYEVDPSEGDDSLSDYGSCQSYTDNKGNSKVKGKKFSPPDKRGNTASVHTITRFMTFKGVSAVKKIRLYNSSVYTNAPIINAVTGLAYYTDSNMKYKVGSIQEDDLFKVRFLTREANLPGMTLFYDSPDQYERHLGVVVNEKIKQKYNDRRSIYDKKCFDESE
jgi:hypothetical protein